MLVASELNSHTSKIKIGRFWYTVNRVWVVGDFVEISTAKGIIKFDKNATVEAKNKQE